jgi:hypothetical protein
MTPYCLSPRKLGEATTTTTATNNNALSSVIFSHRHFNEFVHFFLAFEETTIATKQVTTCLSFYVPSTILAGRLTLHVARETN